MSQRDEPGEVEAHRGGEDAVAILGADAELHRQTEETFEINVVPTFLRIAARGEIIDLHEVKRIVAEHRREELRFIANLLPAFDRVADDLAVFVAEEVRGIPAGDAEVARTKRGSEDGFEPRLPGLAIAPGVRNRGECVFPAVVGGEIDKRTAGIVGQPGVLSGGGVFAGGDEIEDDDGVKFVFPAEFQNVGGAAVLAAERAEARQFFGDGLEPVRFEDAVAECGFVYRFTSWIPAGKDDVIHGRQAVGFAVALGNQRARRSEAAPHERHPRDECAGNGSVQPGDANSQSAHKKCGGQ